MKSSIFLALSICFLAVVACGKKEEPTAATAGETGAPSKSPETSKGTDGGTTGAATANFAAVSAILTKNCVGCHGDHGKGGIDLRTFASITKGGEEGPIVTAGNSKGSKLVMALMGQGAKQMPPKGKLDDADIATISGWIDGGAKEN